MCRETPTKEEEENKNRVTIPGVRPTSDIDGKKICVRRMAADMVVYKKSGTK